MDVIFGTDRFKNEIIWHYNTGGKGKKTFLRKHDVIFWYSKGKEYNFYHDQVALERKVGTAHLRHGIDPDGREYYEDFSPRKSGKQYRWYLDQGLTPMDVWTDIQALNPSASERLGYPTQKPVQLLRRIINACSKEGDWVLDPFGGCGTTARAAEELKRNWSIIDVTTLSINLVKRRIDDMYEGQKVPPMYTDGLPEDLSGAKALFESDPFEFEYWACDLINARPAGDKKKGKMKGADQGIDGVITFPDQTNGSTQTTFRKLLVQVKGGHVAANQVRDFWGTIEREKAAGGIFISLEKPTKPMIKDAVEAGDFIYHLTGQKYPKIQIVTVEDLLNGKLPNHPSSIPYAKKAEKVEIKNPTLF